MGVNPPKTDLLGGNIPQASLTLIAFNRGPTKDRLPFKRYLQFFTSLLAKYSVYFLRRKIMLTINDIIAHQQDLVRWTTTAWVVGLARPILDRDITLDQMIERFTVTFG